MKKIHVIWKGISPLIMHNCQCVNPLHPISKEIKKYTSKRIKTEEDLQIISDLEWEAGAYWKDGLGSNALRHWRSSPAFLQIRHL